MSESGKEKTILTQIIEMQEILSNSDFKALVQEIDFAELVEKWDSLDKELRIKIFLNLETSLKADLIINLPVYNQEDIIKSISEKEVKQLLTEVEPDDITDFFQELDEETKQSIWEGLSEEAKKETLYLLKFNEDDAAGLMNPRYIAIKSNTTVEKAINFVRKNSSKVETLFNLYVIDSKNHLEGLISLKDLLASKNNQNIEDIMTKDPVSVPDDMDQEEVAKLLETYDVPAIPVVDAQNTLLGVVTFDDVIDVINEENTEDIYKMGAISGNADSYFETSIFRLITKRLPWLILLLILGTITTNVLNRYDELIQSHALIGGLLFVFMQVITQTGGNTGNQSSTLIIRGLATDDIKFRDIGKVLLREIIIGASMGIITGAVITLRSMFIKPQAPPYVALVIGISLSIVVIFSNIIGAIAPILISKIKFGSLKLDPAVMSAPLMATLIDVCGLILYFEIAKLLLHL